MKLKDLVKELQFHGGRRLGEKRYGCFWWLPMLMLFGSAVTVIYVTIWRYFDNPTYMVKEESVGNKMDFPSVIVCPEVFFPEDKIDRFLSNMEIPPKLNISYLKTVMVQLGAFFAPDIIYKTQDLENIEHLLEYNNMDADTAGMMLTTSCENSLIRCRWQGAMIDCSDVFHLRLTADGYCCVFNGRSLSRELTNGNFKEIYRKWQTETFGVESGLMLVVNQSQELSNVDLSYKWYAVQSNRHYVESTINGTALNPGSEQWVAYFIRNFRIAYQASKLSDSLRRCRLTSEPLKFFPIYTKKYCVVECEMARTLKRCNCVRLVHPRPKGSPYCGASQLLCAQQAMVPYDSAECNCLPACDVATNNVQITTFELLSEVQPIDAFYDDLDFKKVTIVRTFIQSRKLKTFARWSYFNSVDLFAQLGGVFNVFFGCSVLTLLELGILTLRAVKQLISTLRRRNIQPRTNQKSDQKNAARYKNIKKRGHLM